MHILIADGDLPSVTFTSFLLKEAGYQVSTAGDAAMIVEAFERRRPDLVLLEVMLPTASGFDICRQIRRNSDIPIIFLSGCLQICDRVMGLQIGADDFLTKPFEPAELLARIEAVMRRCNHFAAPDSPARLSQGDLTLDPVGRTVIFRHGGAIALTPIEFRLLYYLMANAGQILNTYQIHRSVWGEEDLAESSLTATYIRRLRTKIEPDATHPRRIVTVRNLGYKYEV